MPNIDHIVEHCGFSARTCERALSKLEKDNWIVKIRKRCHDGAVRLFLYVTDKFKSIMGVTESLCVNKENTPKNYKKPSFYADSAKMTESDSVNLSVSYIKEENKKEQNNNLEITQELEVIEEPECEDDCYSLKTDFDTQQIADEIAEHTEIDLEDINLAMQEVTENYDLETENECVNAVLLRLGLINDDEFYYLCENDLNGIAHCLLGGRIKAMSNTTTESVAKITKKNTFFSKNDIEMPPVKKEDLRKDLVGNADQEFHSGVLPYSQCVALVAIIDYVKRQNVVIGCDKEMYQWLYHMASNQAYYYSNAINFRHWCNIAMSQLKQRRLNRPAGFGKWMSMVENNTLEVAA